MLSSKANAALTRLKEIEEKYKIKRREEKWKHKEDSSISSISINPSENLSTEEKETSKDIVKPKLNIKMPNARIEEPVEDSKAISDDKESKSERISSKSLEDAKEINFDIRSGYKLRRTVGKQESSNSDVTTIQENSSIESVLDDSITLSKSSAQVKRKSQGEFLKINESSNYDKSDIHENTIKTNSKLRKERLCDKPSDMSGRRFSKSATSSNNSSIARQSRLSEKSNGNVSKSHSDTKTRERVLMKEAEAVRTPEIVSFTRRISISNHSGLIRDDNDTNESIATIEDGSEIISEFSQTEKSVVDKIESVSGNVSSDHKYPISENVSTYTSNNSKHSIIGNRYANDTFENISSSTVRSESKGQGEKMIEGEKEIGDNAGFDMRQKKIVSHERYQSCKDNTDTENSSDEQGVIELVASKVMHGASICEISLDRELSNRVKNSGCIDANPNDVVSRSLNSSKSNSSHSEKLKKSHKYQTGSSHEPVENVTIADKNTSVSSTIINTAKSSISDDTMMMEESITRVRRERSRRKSSSEIRMLFAISNQHESARKKCGKVSDGMEERAMIDAGGLFVTGDEGKIELPKSSIVCQKEKRKERKEDDNVFDENSQQLISECTTNTRSVLRKLQSDATNRTIKQYTTGLKTTISENFSGNNDEEIQDATLRKLIVEKENATRHSRKKDEKLKFNNGNYEHKDRKNKREVKVIYSKPVETCKCNESRKEKKDLRLNEKQIRRLRKQIVELRLQREQENVRKYLQECKRLKLGLSSCPVQSYFSPLEFPKITEFTHYDIKLQTHDQDVLRERISGIRQWLKNQYTLYRDYCVMAQAINKHYVPATLKDAKKTIRKMRKTVIKMS